ncbi:MAG: arginine--tRNA ligase [Spirochaetaceae bacterium]|jgi:arginyl-tRNA synthetase|nr:arginine--tRNA ligase [Spirochaetaceae bacterium]
MDEIMDEKNIWKEKICAALNEALEELHLGETVDTGDIIAELPPKPEMGDLGFPMFPFAKKFKKSPPQIAALVVNKVNHPSLAQGSAEVFTLGPYVNVKLDRAQTASRVISAALNANKDFFTGGKNSDKKDLCGKKIMVEFSSPNTNKPLHLGHLRNDVLGESISRILAACNAEVQKVCIINDRGIHICKSMLAYQEYGNGETPESAHIKSDHFVGKWYVRFSLMEKMEKAEESALERARQLLLKWEAGDTETVALWKQMNQWTVNGMKETYKRTDISFDKYYFESDTYLRGKDEVLKGLERGLFTKEVDGSIQADLTAENLDKKVLLRKDGTSLYITQDFGTAILRHDDWAFDKLVYVVGSEQRYHFQVLFILLAKMGFAWAKDLYHLSYGMVNLPEGKMKSREGTVVDADDLIDELRDMALAEIRDKAREEIVGDAPQTAEKIALGALHYYLLQVSPERDMLFNPKESLSFNGNTGPYLQYMGARISSILQKDEAKALLEGKNDDAKIKFELLVSDSEWELVKTIAAYPEALEAAARAMNPSLLASFLYELSKNFARFYHECPVLNADTQDLQRARLELCRAVLAVLRAALNLVCIPFLESM